MRRPWKSKQQRPLDCQRLPKTDYGLETLHDAENCDVDIVAVHGLYGSRSATWVADNGVNWLSDLLPSHIPTARVLMYGYDSTAHSSQHIVQKILFSRARKMIANLDTLRRETQSEQRPIIFTGHSLGGILIKSALIQSEWAKLGEEKNLYAIKQSTTGIVFFGTPHHGTSTISWRQLLENVVAVQNSIVPAFDFLEKDSEWLEIQTEQYKSISTHLSNYYCYETRSSPSLCFSAPVVPRHLACPYECVRDGHRCVALDADHCNLCKIKNGADPNYQSVLGCFRSIYQQRYVVVSRWASFGCGSDLERPLCMTRGNDDFRLRAVLPYHRNKHFVGREAELEEIHASLCGGLQVHHSCSVLLHGIGGIGKTQIALEYAYRHREEFSSILWLDARDHWSVQASLLAIVQDLVDHYKMLFQDAEQPCFQASEYLGLKTIVDGNGRINPDYGSSKIMGEAFREWLSRQSNNRWLLVIDSFDDDNETHVSELLSQIPWGRRLYTTRRQGRVQCELVIRLTALTVHESKLLFSAHSGKPLEAGDKYGMITASQRLGGLPGQIAQAGDYLKVVSAPLGISKGNVCRTLQASLDGVGEVSTGMSLFHLAGRSVESTSLFATELLFLCSIFHYADIPMETLKERYDPFDDEAPCLLQILRILQPLFFITPGNKNNCISLLPQLHEQLQQLQRPEDSLRSAKQGSMMIATAIKRVHVMGAGAERISSVERRALPHIESCLRWIERLWTSDEQLPDFKLRLAWTILGSVCEHQGKLQEARRLVILATRGSIWESLRIPSGVDWHGALRRDDERRQAHCDALHDEIKDRPITNPMSVLATLDLAASHLEQANYKQAKGLYKSLLMTIEQTQSPNSPDALRLVEHLANTYQSSGQSEQSQMLFERQLLAVEDQYGFDSAVSRSVSRDLVQACELFGHYSRAERLVRRGMLADEERLGPEHPTVLRSLGHLAVLADEQGHFEESEALFARAISGYKKVYGDDHSVTLNACENLALSYRLRGRRDQAEILLWSNFETRTRVPGGRSDLLRTVERLTAILEEQGKREEARSLREKFPEQCARDMCAISVSSI